MSSRSHEQSMGNGEKNLFPFGALCFLVFSSENLEHHYSRAARVDVVSRLDYSFTARLLIEAREGPYCSFGLRDDKSIH